MKKERSQSRNPTRRANKAAATRLRIVSGRMKNKKVAYNGDPGTRPMKERTREAVFSLLGGKFFGHFVVDMFAGTGILAFEAISRGAGEAVLLELARPCVSEMLQSARELGIDDVITIQNVDTIRWLKNIESIAAQWPREPWIIFCCPPYKLWVAEGEKVHRGLVEIFRQAPPGSQIICESDKTFDLETGLPDLVWDVRSYPPAFVGLCDKVSEE